MNEKNILKIIEDTRLLYESLKRVSSDEYNQGFTACMIYLDKIENEVKSNNDIELW